MPLIKPGKTLCRGSEIVHFQYFNFPIITLQRECLCWNAPAVPDANRPCPSHSVVTASNLLPGEVNESCSPWTLEQLQKSRFSLGFYPDHFYHLPEQKLRTWEVTLFISSIEAFQILLSSSDAHKTQTQKKQALRNEKVYTFICNCVCCTWGVFSPVRFQTMEACQIPVFTEMFSGRWKVITNFWRAIINWIHKLRKGIIYLSV